MNRKTAALGLLLVLLAVGVFAGGLMTWHHDVQLYGGQQVELVGCQESTLVSCDVVNTSAWSELLGVPIATLGIPFYLTMMALAFLAIRGRDEARALLMAGGVFATGYSVFLAYISLHELNYVCLWCMRLYAINLSLLLLPWVGGRPPKPSVDFIGGLAGVYVALLIASVGGEHAYRSSINHSSGVAVSSTAVQFDQDPTGPAPALSFQVTTEDGNARTLTLEPDDAWAGNKDAQVAVVMFADLECPFCKRTSAEVGRLMQTYGDRVLFVFKHFPMDPTCNAGVKNKLHRSACVAARAAVCAQRQGRFWAFHDLAYKNQHQLGDDALRAYAVEVGVNGDPFDTCMRSTEADAVVKGDAAAGAQLDIHGTPRIFINGKLYRSGSTAEVMATDLETALGASAVDAAAHAAALREKVDAAPPIPVDVPAQRSVKFGDKAFQIDTFEAAIRDGKAVSGKHEIPGFDVSWSEAKSACEASGKRLCTEAEWVSVCQNAAAVDDNHNGELADDMIEGTAYPYGDYHDPQRCWDGKSGDAFRPVYTGEMPGCVTPTGVYDMTGNVEEWVGDSTATAVLLGGAWDTSEDHARCYRRNDSFGAGYSSVRTGFRCCASAP